MIKSIKELKAMSNDQLFDITLLNKKQLIKNNIIESFHSVQNLEDALSVAQTFINSHNDYDYSQYQTQTDEEIETNKKLALIILKEREE